MRVFLFCFIRLQESSMRVFPFFFFFCFLLLFGYLVILLFWFQFEVHMYSCVCVCFNCTCIYINIHMHLFSVLLLWSLTLKKEVKVSENVSDSWTSPAKRTKVQSTSVVYTEKIHSTSRLPYPLLQLLLFSVNRQTCQIVHRTEGVWDYSNSQIITFEG